MPDHFRSGLLLAIRVRENEQRLCPISTPSVTSNGRWRMRNGSALTLDQAAFLVALKVPAVSLLALDDLGDGKQAFYCILRQSR